MSHARNVTLRSVDGLAAHDLVDERELPELEKVAARYAVAITSDVAALIDPSDPNDPIARQYVPSISELETLLGKEPILRHGKKDGR